MGKLMAPEFKRADIPMRRGGATVAAGGILGGLIPPSTIIIIYSLTVNVSPVELNLAAILPGILVLLFIFLCRSCVRVSMSPHRNPQMATLKK